MLIVINHKKEIANLVGSAKRHLDRENISKIIYCFYYGRESDDRFEVNEEELYLRIDSAIKEGCCIELATQEEKLFACQWEYPGPKPIKEYFINGINIPIYVKDLDGE